ncbi:MAG: ATP-binding protein [Chloroflexi bacterium]|nr:ATP-binding protein [Chloroflexota bacterium]
MGHSAITPDCKRKPRSGAEEGAYLEFKKPSEFIAGGRFNSDEFSRQLAETASAFLNSDGGVILVGVQADPDATDKKVERLRDMKDWNPDETFDRCLRILCVSVPLPFEKGG